MKILTVLITLLLATGVLAQNPTADRIKEKSRQVQQRIPQFARSGGSMQKVKALGAKVKTLGQQGRFQEAEVVLDQMLSMMSATPNSQAPSSRWAELVVQGDRPNMGIYDLSLEYDNEGVGWMAYTAAAAQNNQATIETHLAKSTDQGKTWTYVTDLNKARPATLNGESGVWWNEVPTIVYDPDDPGKEWKLYYHKYFANMPYRSAADRRLQYGWIATKTASNPEGPWSDEEALFGAGRFPEKPYSARINISNLSPELSSYFVITELGSLYHDGKLYLSVQGVRKGKGSHPDFDIFLVSSDDHGKTWNYVSTPLKAHQAKQYGGDGWTGTSLAKQDGRVFLLVCPEMYEKPVNGHRGTLVFEFDDIDTGRLNLSPTRRINPDLAKGGQSDFDEQNVRGGIIFPQTDPRNMPRRFRLYRTESRLF